VSSSCLSVAAANGGSDVDYRPAAAGLASQGWRERPARPAVTAGVIATRALGPLRDPVDLL